MLYFFIWQIFMFLPIVSQGSSIIIGQTYAATGAGSLSGQSLHAGLVIAFAEANAAGGIHGHNITLLALDDGYNPDNAVANFHILTDQVLLMAGTFGTDSVAALQPLLLKHHMPSFGPFTGAAITRTPFQEELINVRASYHDEMVAQAAFLVEHLKVHRIACLYQSDGFGQTGLSSIRAALHHVGIELIATGSYTRSHDDVEAAVRAIADVPVPAQAVVLVALQEAATKFIQLYRSDPRTDPDCCFVLMSVAASSFSIIAPRNQWHNLHFSQVVPLPNDPNSAVAQRFALAAAMHHPFDTPPDTVCLEGYITGRLIVQVLQGIHNQPITRQAVLDQVYSTRIFTIDDIALGIYNRNYQGCEAVLCGCNSGMRQVSIAMLNTSGELVAVPNVPSIHFPVSLCESPTDAVKRPIIFGQLIPPTSHEWSGFAGEMGAGINAAFDKVNCEGGLYGHRFTLIQQQYTTGIDGTGALIQLMNRYAIVGTVANVLPAMAELMSPIPAAGTYHFGWHSNDNVFNPLNFNIQPTIAMEAMALVDYAKNCQCTSIHFRAPSTSEGRRILQYLIQSSHTLQTKVSSMATFDDEVLVHPDVVSGCVVVVGSDAVILQWVNALILNLNLHLLTFGAAAAFLLADPSWAKLPHAKRVLFPQIFPTHPTKDESWAWRYGYISGMAIVEALQHSNYATNAFITSDQLIQAWYSLGMMELNGTVLGPYRWRVCEAKNLTDCKCNQGAQTIFITSLAPGGMRTPYRYVSSTCQPVYTKSQGPLMTILTATLGTLIAIVLAGAFWHWCKSLRELHRMRMQFSNDNIAERCAEAIAKFRLEELAWLQALNKPNRVQASFLNIVHILTEVRPFIPDQLLSTLLNGNDPDALEGTEKPIAPERPPTTNVSTNPTETMLNVVPAASGSPSRHITEYCPTVERNSSPHASSDDPCTPIDTTQATNPANAGFAGIGQDARPRSMAWIAPGISTFRPPSNLITTAIGPLPGEWTQKRSVFMFVRLCYASGPSISVSTEYVTQLVTELLIIGKTNGATIDQVTSNWIALHWGITTRSTEAPWMATVASLQMASERSVINSDALVQFTLRIVICHGLCDISTVNAAGHRFFLVNGVPVRHTVDLAMSEAIGQCKWEILISPAVYDMVKYKVYCMPRLLLDGKLWWQPLRQREIDHLSDEWMYEINNMESPTNDRFGTKVLLQLFDMAQKGINPLLVKTEALNVREKYLHDMTPGDVAAVDYLIASLS